MTSGTNRTRGTRAAVLALTKVALALFTVASCATQATAEWFGDPIDTTLPGIAKSIAVGPLNGDSYTDAVVTVGNGDIYVLLNDGTGHFSVGGPVHAPNVERVALGDFDGDGNLDAVTIDVGQGQEFHVAWGDGDGGLSTPETRSANGWANSMTAADVDQDGVDDLVLATRAQVGVWWGGAGGDALTISSEFEASLAPNWPCGYDGTVSLAVAAGDLDGDGFLDLVTASYFIADPWNCDEHYGDLGLGLFMSSGNPRDRDPVLWIVRDPYTGAQNEIRDLDLGDVDGDGWTDVLVVQCPPGLRPFLNRDDDWVEAPGNSDTTCLTVRLADVDADGVQDAVLGRRLWALSGDGSGTFIAEESREDILVAHELCEFNGAPGIDVCGIVSGAPVVRVFPNALTGPAASPGPVRHGMLVRIEPSVTASTCRITFSALLGTPEHRSIRIVDSLGRIVTDLGVAGPASAVAWDLTDASGRAVPAGMYWAIAPDGRGRARVVVVR